MSDKNEIRVSPKTGERIQRGSLWIFKSEIQNDLSSFSPGEIVRVRGGGGFIGKGYIHPRQTLAVRLLTLKDEPITPAFFEAAILNALALREKLGFSSQAPRRLVHAEGDGLPGLVVDQYGGTLVAQFLTMGMEKWKPVLLDLLKKIFLPEGILEKSAGDFRIAEGMEEVSAIRLGNIANPILIKQDGISFHLDLLEGHKTGFYLDQRENRRKLKDYVAGAEILDPFAYTGGMSLYAAAFGATRVEAVEDSRKAYALLEKNVRENKMEGRVVSRCGNAFHYLREKMREGKKYDCIILDPPSFAKSKRELAGAMRGYKEIHLSAFKLLRPGGFLITYSCSQNVREEAFFDGVLEAAYSTRRKLQLLDRHGASRDHPVRAGMPETEYLKGFVFRVS